MSWDRAETELSLVSTLEVTAGAWRTVLGRWCWVYGIVHTRRVTEKLHIHISTLSVTPALILWNHFLPSEKESWP